MTALKNDVANAESGDEVAGKPHSCARIIHLNEIVWWHPAGALKFLIGSRGPHAPVGTSAIRLAQ